MTTPDDRLSPSVSRYELERRWTLARAAMEAAGLEAMVVQGAANTVGIGGHFRWFTGACPLTSYPQSVVFPAQGPMTLVAHGGFNSEARLGGGDPAYPGVERRLGVPSFPQVHYTGTYDADLIAQEIRAAGAKKVGLVGANSAYHGLMERLVSKMGGYTVVEGCPAYDGGKARERAEEKC